MGQKVIDQTVEIMERKSYKDPSREGSADVHSQRIKNSTLSQENPYDHKDLFEKSIYEIEEIQNSLK